MNIGTPWAQKEVSTCRALLEHIGEFMQNMKTKVKRKEQQKVKTEESGTQIKSHDLQWEAVFHGKWEMHRGGTNFEKPLADAYRICRDRAAATTTFALYFMSDGSASFPEESLSRFEDPASDDLRGKIKK